MKSIIALLFPVNKKYSFTRIKMMISLIMLIVSLFISIKVYPLIKEINIILAIITCAAIFIFGIIVIGGSVSSYIIGDIKKRQF